MSVGIFNAAIFNSAVFNTGAVVTGRGGAGRHHGFTPQPRRALFPVKSAGAHLRLVVRLTASGQAVGFADDEDELLELGII